jgi:hypothetical protein
VAGGGEDDVSTVGVLMVKPIRDLSGSAVVGVCGTLWKMELPVMFGLHLKVWLVALN